MCGESVFDAPHEVTVYYYPDKSGGGDKWGECNTLVYPCSEQNEKDTFATLLKAKNCRIYEGYLECLDVCMNSENVT